MPHRRIIILGLALSSLGGCVGTVDEPPWRPGGNVEPPVTCEEGREDPVTAPLTRLSRDEYEASLRALVGDATVDAIAPALAGLPGDEPEGEVAFGRTDQRISPQHISGYYAAADAVASRVSGDRALREQVAGACAADAVDETCLRSFAERFLRLALRRAPEGGEVDRAVSVAMELDGFERLHAVLFTTLMSPDFIYRFENRGDLRDNDTVIELTPFELATRLSYHFWGEPPDEALLLAAEDGSLGSDDGYAAQVDRLIDDPRADATLIAFFEEWLHLDRGPFSSSPRLDVLRDGIATDGLAAEMREEIRDLIRYELDQGGSWGDVLTSPRSFARTDRLASIYGVEVWDGAGAPPLLPEGERSGLLTRAGMLYTSDGSTNPFRRGAFLRRSLLCDHVDPPPGDLPADALTPPPVVAGQSTRDAFAAKVVDEPCRSCHAQFSPLGYALEPYDGLGRYRTEEWLVTTMGEDRGYATLDLLTVPRVEITDETPTMGAVELSQRIADSPKANLCLSAQYFRFTFRREEQGYDRCVVEGLARRIDEGMSLRDALRAIAFEPGFRRRRLEN